MKVLVIGSGGREHALLWKLSQSPSVTDVYVVPGNDGMSDVASLVPIKGNEDIIDFAPLMQVDLTVAGPETVLTEGLADEFEKRGMAFFGPSKAAARIEGSKGFAKALMKKYGIPTAAYETFDDEEKAIAYLKANDTYPIVIKADGLAAGKGVIIAQSEEEAIDTVKDMLEGHAFSGAGSSVVIEGFMEGEEASMLCFCDGTNVVPMISAQDHKRIFDFDKGPNTGGMGAYSPVPHLAQSMVDEAVETIIKPVVNGMIKEGRPYTGILYAGLILTKDGPKVIEFNARFGDPETQVILPRLTSDFAVNMLELLTDKVPNFTWLTSGVTLGVVVASEGYPGDYAKGVRIPEKTSGEMITYYAGVATDKENQFVTSGGRVYLLATTADTVSKAQEAIYTTLAAQETTGLFYRNDIGDKAHV